MGRLYDGEIPAPSRKYQDRQARNAGRAQGFVLALIALAVLAGGGFAAYTFLFHH